MIAVLLVSLTVWGGAMAARFVREAAEADAFMSLEVAPSPWREPEDREEFTDNLKDAHAPTWTIYSMAENISVGEVIVASSKEDIVIRHNFIHGLPLKVKP